MLTAVMSLPVRRGLIMGLWNSHTSVGNILGSLIAGYWVSSNWGLSFIVPGVIIAVMGVVCFLFLIEREFVARAGPVRAGDQLAPLSLCRSQRPETDAPAEFSRQKGESCFQFGPLGSCSRLLMLFLPLQPERKSCKSVNGHSDGLQYKDNNNQVCVCVCWADCSIHLGPRVAFRCLLVCWDIWLPHKRSGF